VHYAMIHYSLAMALIKTQLTAGEVLRTFHRDEPYLFLGSAFTTIGIVCAAFCLLRRRLDAKRWAKSQDDDLTVLVCDFLPAG
jgi:hypothetical protein